MLDEPFQKVQRQHKAPASVLSLTTWRKGASQTYNVTILVKRTPMCDTPKSVHVWFAFCGKLMALLQQLTGGLYQDFKECIGG